MKNIIKLNFGKIVLFFISIILMANFAYSSDSAVKIGVLAKRGAERCLEKWSSTAEYLTENIPGKTFVIVPIVFEQIYSVVEKGEIDFILANPSFYVELENWYKVNRIATLKNKVLGGIYIKYGGVIFCKKQREDIRNLIDLKGKAFMAVKETSFGGWRMAWRELKEAGIDSFKNFASLSFVGTHDAVVYAVRDGKVDAGTVRTDTLERMNAEGKISIDDFYIIHEHRWKNFHFPFLHSTRAYPEWPIAKLKHTSNEVAEKVAVALIGMPQDSAAAQAAICAGWTIPLNYQAVHDCLKELKVGPYKDLGEIALTDVFRKYWILILINFATLVVLAWFLATHIILNRKIKAAHRKLEIEVNERIQTEEALRESEEKHRLIAENTVDCIWQMNLDLEFTYINQKTLPFLGYTREEYMGSKLPEYCSSEEMKKIQLIILDILANLPDKTIEVFETTLYHKNGEEIPCEICGKIVLDDSGNPIYFQGITRDITERKHAIKSLQESEEKLAQAIQGILIPTFIIDNNHIITHWNKSAENLTGISAAEMVGTKKHWIAFYPTERSIMVDFIVDGATRKEICGHYEGTPHKSILIGGAYEGEKFFSNLGENGKWLFCTAAPLRDHAGNIIGAIETFQDITERKSTEAQLRQAQKMEAIGTLAGGVAHDFNNILTTIICNVNLALMRIGKDGTLREEIEEIKISGERAASLTRQLLAFSRKQVIKPEVLDLNDVINETEKMLKRMIGEDIEFQTILKPELWKVHMDPGQIDQMIINIAVNARDAMPQGGKLTIETTNIDLDKAYFRDHGAEGKPGPYVMLAISDTGSGMDKETREHIFEPFFTTKEIGKGTGLGLSTVYGIAKQNKGFIWVYSEPGQGTTFKIYLPKVKEGAEAEEKERTPVGDLNGSETVFIVEDDDRVRNLALKILERYGYSVLEAENGEDALRVSKEHDGSIHLMITDVVMPKMSGRETAERLQPLYPKMKVIYMSGYTDDAIVHHGVLAPGLNFLEKPFTPEGLARKVREVLDIEN